MRTHFKHFLPQCIMSSGGMLSGLWAFPPFSSFMIVVSSEVVKGVIRWPPTPHTPHITLHCLLTKRLRCVSATLKRPLANSCFAMELAVIGDCFRSDLRPVRRLKVFQAFLLQWVKSIPLTVSSHRSLRFLLR